MSHPGSAKRRAQTIRQSLSVGAIDDQSVACKVETGRALAIAGLHPATGGSGLELCSGDMLLEALVACAGVTLKAVATALEFQSGGRVRSTLSKSTSSANRAGARLAHDDTRGFLLSKPAVRFAMRLIRGAMCVFRVPVSAL